MNYKSWKVYKCAQFNFEWPFNIAAIFMNPAYFARKNLYLHIKGYSKLIQGKVLDFGCGSKPYAHLFSHCEKYVGCDVLISGHDHSGEVIDIYYDGKNLPFENASFDWVISSQVFEHIPNLDEILKELNRILVHGGGALITVPFVWVEHEVPYDYTRYTSYGIKDLLERHGFEVIEVEKSGLFVETIFQMMIAHISGATKFIRIKYLRGLVNRLLTIAFVLIGCVMKLFFPLGSGLYLDNIVLCKKI